MKKVFSLLFFTIICFGNLFSQSNQVVDLLPELFRIRLQQAQERVTEAIDSSRVRGVMNLSCCHVLNCVFPVNRIDNIDYRLLSNDLLFTEAHRLRILEVLNDEWPEWELQAITQRSLAWSVPGRRNLAERIAQTDSLRTKEMILDSLLKIRYEEIRNRYKNDTRWHRAYARLASFINDERFIEPLKRVYNEDPEFYGYLLARMGVEPYLSRVEAELIARMREDNSGRFFNMERMRFMPRTQTLFKHLSEHLLRDDTYDLIERDDAFHFRRVAELIFLDLANEEIRDLFTPEERENFRFPRVEGRVAFTKEHARRLYDWMQENYGNYKIRPF